MEIKTLLEQVAVRYYIHCEVTQIILYDKDLKKYWNYFTNIIFLNNVPNEAPLTWITNKPRKINKRFKVMILKRILPVEKVINILDKAVESQKWEYGNDCACLDEVFLINPCYIPKIDPTGSKDIDYKVVSIEKSLYGTTFRGNYYIIELFSSKRFFDSVLCEIDRKRIQNIIDSCQLQLKLDKLRDRIGNIVCKLPLDILVHKTIQIIPDGGIKAKITRSHNIHRDFNCYLNILQINENDNTIIENTITPFVLSDIDPEFIYEIEPNRYHNRITISDQNSGIIYYSVERDNGFGNDYYNQIMPPYFISTTSKCRKLTIDGIEKNVSTVNFNGYGNIDVEKDIYEIHQRDSITKDILREEKYYFNLFSKGDESKAISTVINILNDNSLFWDLDEIWVMDPYLSAKDILKTVVLCEKYGVKIKCLTSISTINKNPETRIDDEADEEETRFQVCKNKFFNQLNIALPEDTDINLEFRTIRGTHGEPFHDRYLILNYRTNRCRAWSLGISLNALGSSHHIIQIVENPVAVASMFKSIWDKTDCDECLIYKNI